MSVPCRYRQFLRNVAPKCRTLNHNQSKMVVASILAFENVFLNERRCGQQASEHLSLTNFYWKIPRYSERLKGKLILHFCFGRFVMIGINVSENQNWSSIWFFTFLHKRYDIATYHTLYFAILTNTNVTINCGSLQYTINQSDIHWLDHKQQK